MTKVGPAEVLVLNIVFRYHEAEELSTLNNRLEKSAYLAEMKQTFSFLM